ncbi:hypothetical protein [Photobacterium sp.]|uniref:hypothetical protein n=1 Tax=Photobacterium sp. TaxID=660 RepID=UPI00299E3997|nr:hypothetical protein [Photobacterium sp.]MDX1304560.1 hypothetical protein [Photobacterium sp.]
MMKKLLLLSTLFFSSQGSAQTWVEVNDASKLLWQMSANGTVYFRNLNEFDPAQGACCYAYNLDTTTPGGKSIWSMILTKIASKKRITLGFPSVASNNNPQTLNYIGRHSHASNE